MERGKLLERMEKELDSVMTFWLRHSHDTEHGGFYTCLSESGEVYDTVKYGWMQGRQVWMYSKLYNTVPTYHTAEVLEAAERAGQFMMRHLRVPGSRRCYFSVTADGQPVQLQRKPYTESFYIIGLAELARATGKRIYQEEAEEMLSQLIHWIREDDSELGRAKLPGAPPHQELARPMVLLNTITEFCWGKEEERARYEEDIKWCREHILMHCQGQWVLENVSPNGSAVPGCLGRLTNPGHAIEAGWFLLQEARSIGDQALAQRAIDSLILAPYSYGWDQEHDGLFYYLDSGGHSPTQLEWSMKLWWVHCEAMVALLMAYSHTHSPELWDKFCQVCQFTFTKFVDSGTGAGCGEWYGYLTREGKVNQTFKGGPYKGCFHIPRSLLLCVQMLKDLTNSKDIIEGK